MVLSHGLTRMKHGKQNRPLIDTPLKWGVNVKPPFAPASRRPSHFHRLWRPGLEGHEV
jgi:hypothetical protein